MNGLLGYLSQGNENVVITCVSIHEICFVKIQSYQYDQRVHTLASYVTMGLSMYMHRLS